MDSRRYLISVSRAFWDAKDRASKSALQRAAEEKRASGYVEEVERYRQSLPQHQKPGVYDFLSRWVV